MVETQECAVGERVPHVEEHRSGRWKLREYAEMLLVTAFLALGVKTFVIEAYRIPSGSMEDTLQVGDYLLVNKLPYGATTPRRLPFVNIPLPSIRLPRLDHPARGDVIVFEHPVRDEEQYHPIYIKRCVALPGDTVAIVNRVLHVNGKAVGIPPGAKHERVSLRAREYQNMNIYPAGAAFNEDNYGPLVVPARGHTIALDITSIHTWKALIEREGSSVDVTADSTFLIDGRPATEYTLRHDYYFMLGDNRDNSLDSRFWGFVPDHLIIGKALMIYWSWDETTGKSRNSWPPVRWSRIGMLIH